MRYLFLSGADYPSSSYNDPSTSISKAYGSGNKLYVGVLLQKGWFEEFEYVHLQSLLAANGRECSCRSYEYTGKKYRCIEILSGVAIIMLACLVISGLFINASKLLWFVNMDTKIAR